MVVAPAAFEDENASVSSLPSSASYYKHLMFEAWQHHILIFANSYLVKLCVWLCWLGLKKNRMRSEGSRFTLGVWGQGCVRQELCLCAQPFASVCVSAVRLSTVAIASGVVPKAYQVDSCRRRYIGVCRGAVCVSDLCRCSCIGVCSGGVCRCIDVCRGSVCVSDLRRRIFVGVCSGGVCVSDLWRRSYFGVSKGGVCM